MILWAAVADNAPPALVVNENVATLEVLRATRSVDAMVKPPIMPESTPVEG